MYLFFVFVIFENDNKGSKVLSFLVAMLFVIIMISRKMDGLAKRLRFP